MAPDKTMLWIMRPAEGERSRTTFPVRRLDMLVGAIAVALNDAGKIPEQLFRPDFPATRHVGVDDRRWIGTAMCAIITSNRPEISRLHLAGAGRQNLGGGLIDEQPPARQQFRFHPVGQAAEPSGGSTRPVAHGSPVDLDALTPQSLCLPIKGHVIGIFLHQNIGDHRLGGQAAWYHMLRRGRLEHAIAARPASHFRAGRHDYAILDRNNIEPARYVAVYAVQRTSAAGAFLLVWKDHFLNAGQMRRQRPPRRPAFPSRPFLLLACRLLAKRLQFSTGDVKIFEGKRQLIFAQLFRPFPKCRAGDLVDDMLHPRFTLEAGQDHCL